MFKRLLLVLILSNSLNASDEDINPLPFDYMNVQYAGAIGFLSIGGGNTFFNDHYDLELYIGLTPRFFEISEIAIYTFAVKNNYIPYTFKYQSYNIRPYMGVGALAAKNQRYDPNWQDDIDRGYYYQNSWHFTANFGINANKKIETSTIKSLGLYAEAVSLDIDIINYFNNKDAINIEDIFSVAFGVRIGF